MNNENQEERGAKKEPEQRLTKRQEEEKEEKEEKEKGKEKEENEEAKEKEEAEEKEQAEKKKRREREKKREMGTTIQVVVTNFVVGVAKDVFHYDIGAVQLTENPPTPKKAKITQS